jgi:anti-sigma factor RsiW
MISPQDLELLTAHVDGELTARQRRHVDRLLRRSAEARALLARLQEDAQQVRGLFIPQQKQGKDAASGEKTPAAQRSRATALRCSIATPFGRPVEPEV